MRPLPVRFAPAPVPPRARFTAPLLVTSLMALGVQAELAWDTRQWRSVAAPPPEVQVAGAARPVVGSPGPSEAQTATTSPVATDAGVVLQALEAAAAPGVRLLAADMLPAEGRTTVEVAAPTLAVLLEWQGTAQGALPDVRWTLLRAQADPAGGLVGVFEGRARFGPVPRQASRS